MTKGSEVKKLKNVIGFRNKYFSWIETKKETEAETDKETVLYAVLAIGRSRNPTAYMKNNSLQEYFTASNHHHCTIADYSHLSTEIVGLCSRVHHWVPVENINEI